MSSSKEERKKEESIIGCVHYSMLVKMVGLKAFVGLLEICDHLGIQTLSMFICLVTIIM
jgi:hypothetical protein